MRERICYVFGAGDTTPCTIQPEKDDLVIAADGGYDFASAIGLKTDIIIGDFDSVKDTNLPANRITHPKEKDDTDMMLVFKYALEKGYYHFEIYGGLGGRLDHTIANLQALTFLAKKGATAVLHGENYKITVLHNSFLTFPAKENGIISVFSLSDKCKGVTIKGLKYPLKHGELTNSFPLGISNEFIGKDVTISVHKGTLGVLWYD